MPQTSQRVHRKALAFQPLFGEVFPDFLTMFRRRFPLELLVLPLVFTCLLLLELAPWCQAEDSPGLDLVIVIDASAAMSRTINAVSRLDLLREEIKRILPTMPPDIRIGLFAGGKVGMRISPGQLSTSDLLAAMDRLNTGGSFDIASAINGAMALLPGKGNAALLIVSSGDFLKSLICTNVRDNFLATGQDLAIHAIELPMGATVNDELSCLAQETGGRHAIARSAVELKTAFSTASRDIERKNLVLKSHVGRKLLAMGSVEVSMPKQCDVSLNSLQFKEMGGGRTVKNLRRPNLNGTFPLPEGEYALVAAFANSNRKPDSETSFGAWKVSQGATTSIRLGGLFIDLADGLRQMPAGAVIVTSPAKDDFQLTLPHTGNSYYFFKPKPLPAGAYRLAVHYQRDHFFQSPPAPVILADTIVIKEGLATTIRIDSGIQLQKRPTGAIGGWELVGENPSLRLKVLPAHDGEYPLWLPYAVPPGTYRLDLLDHASPPGLIQSRPVTVKTGLILDNL